MKAKKNGSVRPHGERQQTSKKQRPGFTDSEKEVLDLFARIIAQSIIQTKK